MQVLVDSPAINLYVANGTSIASIKQLIYCHTGIPACFQALKQGRSYVEDSAVLTAPVNFVSLRLPVVGGKGGFGANLRGGPRGFVKKTTNFGACRDLNGRRLRDVEQEKEMREWIQNKDVREAEEKRRKQERLAARKPRFMFDANKYHEQTEQATNGALTSLEKGLLERKQKKKALKPKRKIKKKKFALDPYADLSDSESDNGPEDVESGDSTPEQGEEPEKNDEEEKEQQPPKKKRRLNESGKSKVEAAPEKKEKKETKLIDLNDYASAKELEKLGLDAIKFQLSLRGMKCGGTMAQRATRLFAVKGLALSAIPKKLLTKKRQRS